MASDEAARREASKPASPAEQRSLTGSAAVDFVMHAAGLVEAGAGGALGAHLVNQVIHRPPPAETTKIELPPGVEK
jgi:hypothetical protein